MTTTRTSKKSTTSAGADWGLRPSSTSGAVVQAGLGLAAVAAVGGAAGLTPWWGAAGAGAGALSAVLVGAGRDHTRTALLYRLGAWAGAGGWLTWMLADPSALWSASGAASLAVGALTAGITAPLARDTVPTAVDAPGTALLPVRAQLDTLPGGRVGLDWQLRIHRVCRIMVTITGLTPWDTGTGFDLACELPGGGATRDTIAARADALAADARLPEGCGVEVLPGADRGSLVLAVTTIDRLGNGPDGESVQLPYPADYTARSILDVLELGEHRDASNAGVHLREDSAVIAGQKRSGKTNQLAVLTLSLLRCTDALTWHIDLNGGGMSQPWLHPWLNGDLDQPPIDWCAPNAEEALLMTTVALAIALDRKTSYRTLKAQTNQSLLPISSKLPEIVVMVDESAELMGDQVRDPILRQVRDNLLRIQQIAGNEAVNTVFSVLRPISTMIPTTVLRQSRVKIGMFGTDDNDLGILFTDYKVKGADLPSKGCAHLGIGSRIRPYKSWYLDPDQIAAAATAVAGHRPRLDPASTEAANRPVRLDLGDGRPVDLENIYASRHQRMRATFTGQDADLPLTSARPASGKPTTRPAPARTLELVKGGAATWPDPLGKPAAPAPAPARGGAASWPDPLPGRTVQATRLDQPAPAPTGAADQTVRPIPQIIAAALQAFDTAGDDRMHSETLAAALHITDTYELAALLRPYGVATLKNKFARGGEERRGYARADVAAAADRAVSGAAQLA